MIRWEMSAGFPVTIDFQNDPWLHQSMIATHQPVVHALRVFGPGKGGPQRSQHTTASLLPRKRGECLGQAAERPCKRDAAVGDVLEQDLAGLTSSEPGLPQHPNGSTL